MDSREVRKRYLIAGVTSAATEVHARYLKKAKELLDFVRNQMTFAGLLQQSGSYVDELGVKLSAVSRFGQDEISIDIPTKLGGRTGDKRELEVEARTLIVVGGDEDEEGFKFPWYWTPGSGTVLINMPDPPNNLGEAFSVSRDGKTIVGWWIDFSGIYAFRWTKAEGFVDMGAIPEPLGGSNFDFAATDCSKDGKVIVGYQTDSIGASSCWHWTAAMGFETLPDFGSGGKFCKPHISSNGRFIAGLTGEARDILQVVFSGPGDSAIEPVAGVATVGVIWERTNDGVTINRAPSPGTTTTYFSDTLIAGTGTVVSFVNDDDSLVKDVDDNGLAVGYSSHRENTPHGLEIGIDNFNPTNVDCVFYWDLASGSYSLRKDGFPEGIADKTSTAVGNTNRGDYVFTPADPPTGAFDEWLNIVPNAWVMDRTANQRSLGDFTFVYDISEEATAMCGYISQDADPQLQQCYWSDGSLTAKRIPLLPGSSFGRAYACATPGTKQTIPAGRSESDLPVE